MTLQKSRTKKYEELERSGASNSYVAASPASPSPSRENGGDSKTPAGQSFSTFADFCERSGLGGLSSKTLKGCSHMTGGGTFRRILQALTELGYCVEWKICNSKNYGVPQNRERVYIVGHFGGACGGEIFFKTGNSEQNQNELDEMTHGASAGYRTYGTGGIAPTLKAEGGGLGAKTGLYLCNVVETQERDEKGLKIWKMINAGIDHCGTVTATYYKGGVFEHGGCSVACQQRIRRLTPRECWRLQGFPDELFDKAAATGLSDTQLYKQAGNAVTVNVVQAIGERIAEMEAGRFMEV